MFTDIYMYLLNYFFLLKDLVNIETLAAWYGSTLFYPIQAKEFIKHDENNRIWQTKLNAEGPVCIRDTRITYHAFVIIKN